MARWSCEKKRQELRRFVEKMKPTVYCRVNSDHIVFRLGDYECRLYPRQNCERFTLTIFSTRQVTEENRDGIVEQALSDFSGSTECSVCNDDSDRVATIGTAELEVIIESFEKFPCGRKEK